MCYGSFVRVRKISPFQQATSLLSRPEPDAIRQLRGGRAFAEEPDGESEVPSPEDAMEPDPVPVPYPEPGDGLPPLTPELRQVILDLARQPDIHSLSCPFKNYDLWNALIEEQIWRSKATGLPYQEAFCLCAPDSGIDGMQQYDYVSEKWPFHTPPIGSDVHTSWEGVCGGDLSSFLPGAASGRAMGPNRMNSASWSGCAATTPFPINTLATSTARRAPSWPGAGTSTGAMHWGYFERGGRNDGAAASSSGSRPSGTRSQTSVGRSDPKRLASKTCWRRMTRSHWNAS